MGNKQHPCDDGFNVVFCQMCESLSVSVRARVCYSKVSVLWQCRINEETRKNTYKYKLVSLNIGKKTFIYYKTSYFSTQLTLMTTDRPK